MSQAASIGHNSGAKPDAIIDYSGAVLAAAEHCQEHTERQAELLSGFARWLAGGAIADDERQGKSGDFVKQIAAEVRRIDLHREDVKRPVLDLCKSVDVGFKGISDPLVNAKGVIERAMTSYAVIKAANERERLQGEAAERQRIAQEAAEMAAFEAELAGEAPPAALADVREALPTDTEISRTYGDHGTVASLRGRWVHEVTDMAAVPREFLMVNDAAIRAAIKGGARKIAGVNIYQEQKIGVR